MDKLIVVCNIMRISVCLRVPFVTYRVGKPPGAFPIVMSIELITVYSNARTNNKTN